MSFQEWVCTSCTLSRADHFCCCGDTETFLCHCCISLHYQKIPHLPHFAYPISAYGQHKIPGYFDRLRVRSANFGIARTVILRNIEAVDRCIEEVTREIESAISAITEYKELLLGGLRQTKQELTERINAAIEEVKHTMYQDSVELENEWARTIRNFVRGRTTMNFFEYKITPFNLRNTYRSLCEFIVKEPKKELFVLPGLIGNTLRIYDIKRNSKTEYTLSQSFSKGCRLCFTQPDQILVIGSDVPSAKAFLISAPNAHVRATRSMYTARRLPALIENNGCVYVFAGMCSQCEKFRVAEETWTVLPTLPSTYAQKCFTPCLYESDIYLTRTSNIIDIFNLTSQAFHQRTITANALNDSSVSIQLNGEIIILTCENQLGRWKLDSDVVEVTNFQQKGERPSSQCPPVLCGREVYFVRWNSGNLNSFNLDTKVLVTR